jgi:hypothetical protein
MKSQEIRIAEWLKSNTQIFWAEIAPCNHIVQIYENDKVILDSLEGFVTSGFKTGESVIIIASEEHLNALNFRLIKDGLDVNELCSSNQYIPLNADKTLSKFMKDGWPDEDLFMAAIKEIVNIAGSGRRIRAYGEMVAILWGQGNTGATIHLEYLWNKFCRSNEFCLFCAYPKSGFIQNAEDSIAEIVSTHTKVIAGWPMPKDEVYYQNVNNIKKQFRYGS